MLILLVDDDKPVLQELRRVLGKAGHGCHTAENGLEALKMALGQRYHLIISDINMPKLDGLKFVQRIRSSERNKDTPVLMLTSMADRSSVERARALGVQGYIVKPVNPDDLLARVRSAVG